MMKLLSKLFCLSAILWVPAAEASTEMPFPLAGSWTLVAADLLHPDGSRTHDYGDAPKGLLLIDNRGRYSAQIYKSERPLFASGDKKTGTAAEFEAAVMGTSAHFGTLMIDTMTHTLVYNIESSAYKNWEGTQQKRMYELHGDELSYQVPPRPDGLIPISVWRRIK
jgi:hypothetical protein